VDTQVRILLVEDDAPLKRSLEKFLRQAGFNLCCCSSAREALDRIEQFSADILIAEYHLPDANGSLLLDCLTRIVPHAATVLISEYDYQWVADDNAALHVHAFLKKPFDVAELETVLTSARCQVQISMRNLNLPVGSGLKMYLPPLTRGKLSEMPSSCGSEMVIGCNQVAARCATGL
jgi:DNA-binding NtrC family response regulator